MHALSMKDGDKVKIQACDGNQSPTCRPFPQAVSVELRKPASCCTCKASGKHGILTEVGCLGHSYIGTIVLQSLINTDVAAQAHDPWQSHWAELGAFVCGLLPCILFTPSPSDKR